MNSTDILMERYGVKRIPQGGGKTRSRNRTIIDVHWAGELNGDHHGLHITNGFLLNSFMQGILIFEYS